MLTRKDFKKQVELVVNRMEASLITDELWFKACYKTMIETFIEFNYSQNPRFSLDTYLAYMWKQAKSHISNKRKLETIREILYDLARPYTEFLNE